MLCNGSLLARFMLWVSWWQFIGTGLYYRCLRPEQWHHKLRDGLGNKHCKSISLEKIKTHVKVRKTELLEKVSHLLF